MPVVEVNWSTIHLFGDAWFQHHQLRKRVFIERCKWALPESNDCEFDEYDTPDATYLLWLNDDGVVRGSVRLISTCRRYMARDLWPDMFTAAPPNNDLIWEATRFCCDHTIPEEERRLCCLELLEATQKFGLARGLDSYVGVMQVAMFRTCLARNGCTVSMLGPALQIEDRMTGASRIEVNAETLAKLRANIHAWTAGVDDTKSLLQRGSFSIEPMTPKAEVQLQTLAA